MRKVGFRIKPYMGYVCSVQGDMDGVYVPLEDVAALEAERDELKALADNLECQLVALKAENNSLWAKEIDASGQRDEALKNLEAMKADRDYWMDKWTECMGYTKT